MSTVFQNVTSIYFDKYNIAPALKAITLKYGCKTLDDTRITSQSEINKGGLFSVDLTAKGGQRYNDSPAEIDTIAYTAVGVQNKPVTLTPFQGSVGDVALSFLAEVADYSPLDGQVGEIIPFDFSAKASGARLVSGQLFVVELPQTASFSSTVIQLGAVAAGQKVYAAAHVVAASGGTPTLDLTVKSAAAAGFASPTTRLTFPTFSAAGSGWQELAGPITDAYWRVDGVIGGSTPSFTPVVMVAIL